MGAAAMSGGDHGRADGDGSSIGRQIQREASLARTAALEANHMAVARRLRKKRSTSAWTAVAGAGASLLALALTSPRIGSGLLGTAGRGDTSGAFLQRRLSQYPNDPLLNPEVGYRHDPNNWLVFIHCIGMLYMLLGLNTVCDVYFAGALEVMVETWHIQADVAGATFMAAGGSAPELFTSLIGAIIAENDVGFGTIVGSAVFNVLFVIGCCGWVAPGGIKLTWWPLFRDSTFYIAGLGLLAFFASNQEISFFEALLLFCFYIVYCVFMWQNPRFEDMAYGRTREKKNDSQVAPEGEVKPKEEIPVDSAANAAGGASSTSYGKLVEDDEIEKDGYEKKKPSKESVASGAGNGSKKEGTRTGSKLKAPLKFEKPPPKTAMQRSTSPDEKGDTAPEEPPADEEEGEEDEEDHFFAFPEGAIPQLMWYLKWPITAQLYYCTPEPGERTFLFTFFLSLVWIAVYSFLLVWWIEILTEVLGWPIIIMGFTVLAAGTSIPDLVSSMAVAKKGEGDMAVSSSIGSNIFDILVGLPIPWMIKIGLVEQNIDFPVSVKSPFITFYVIVLLGMVFMTVLSIHVNKWKLDKKLGPSMMILWIIFLALAIFAEMGPESSTKHLKWSN